MFEVMRLPFSVSCYVLGIEAMSQTPGRSESTHRVLATLWSHNSFGKLTPIDVLDCFVLLKYVENLDPTRAPDRNAVGR